MAYYHYKVKVGIFVVNVQARSWKEAIKKCIDSELFNQHEIEHQEDIKCIEVRQIRGAKDV